MVPRIFISSTYYYLKHVRERLEKFIEAYGFEPVLFESDKVTYQHGTSIDQSSNHEVGLCHMMILIIGGRYGTPINSAHKEEDRRKYDEHFISITRGEFEASVKKNIPVFVFIDKNVNSEYETYKGNQEFFEEMVNNPTTDKQSFKFAHVDHINVFRFISLVKSRPTKTFDKVEEIEVYLRSQLAGLFYLYLEGLKRQSTDNEILDTISELNSITLRMNEMLASVGKQILEKDKVEYERVIEKQFKIILDSFSEDFRKSISLKNNFSSLEIKELGIERISRVIYESVLLVEVPHLSFSNSFEEYQNQKLAFDRQFQKGLQEKLSEIDSRLELKAFDFRRINRLYKINVSPFLTKDEDVKSLLSGLSGIIYSELLELPF